MLRAVLLAVLMVVTSLPAVAAPALTMTASSDARSPAQTASCTDVEGPGIPPPATVPSGLPGYHAAWYGQSGYPTLCPGSTATATVAFINSGSLGWYAGVPGATALLGTSDPEPGQDRPSVLGGTDVGWPAPARVAVQPAGYVGPGQVAWFRFTIRAPQEPGTYRIALRPLIEGVQWMEDYGVFWYVTVKTSDVAAPEPAPVTPVVAAPPPARTYFPAIASDGSRRIRANALMFHYVSWLPPDADALRKDLTVSPTDFEDMLRYLRTAGYNTITTQDLWWSLDTASPLPPNPVLLTFDDGYVDHYEVVMPLLKAYGMVGTFAVTANLVDKPGYMTRAMVRALADNGMDVVSHAVDHYPIAKLRYDGQVYQLCTSRRILGEWTGRDIRHFIYPGGDHLPLPSAALTGCGYLSAYRKDGGSMQSSNEMLALRRARVRGQQGLGALLIALTQ